MKSGIRERSLVDLSGAVRDGTEAPEKKNHGNINKGMDKEEVSQM